MRKTACEYWTLMESSCRSDKRSRLSAHGGQAGRMPRRWLSRTRLGQRRRIPDFQRPIQAARDDPPAVAAEHHTDDPAGMAAQRVKDLASGRIPNLYGGVSAGPGHALLVRAPGHAHHPAGRIVDSA